MTVIQLYPRTTDPTSEAAKALESNLGLIHKAVGSVPMPNEFCDDAFQEAAAAFLRQHPFFDAERGTLSTFMWPYLRGAVTHFLRSLARRPASTEDADLLDLPVEFSTPEFIDIDVAAFIASLGESDRMLLVGVYWHDLTLSDIARRMGVSRQSAHVRHQRMLVQARAHLSPQSISA